MQFQLTILGTSGAVPAYGRNCSGAFLSTERDDVLIDCGEATQIRMAQAGLSMGKVSHVLISHLHGDHYFGLPGLISSLSLSGRKKPLVIISPLHLRPRLAPLFELDRFPMPFELRFETFHAETLTPLVTLRGLEVFAFPLQHRVPTNGYLLREIQRPANIDKEAIERHNISWPEIRQIKEGGDLTLPDGTVIPHADITTPAPPPRSFAYCSDTSYFPELSEYVAGADLLYHEATFLEDMAHEAAPRGHSTAVQAATVARDAGVGDLVMGHYSMRYPTTQGHEAEARAVFPRSHAAHDLWSFAVPHRSR